MSISQMKMCATSRRRIRNYIFNTYVFMFKDRESLVHLGRVRLVTDNGRLLRFSRNFLTNK